MSALVASPPQEQELINNLTNLENSNVGYTRPLSSLVQDVVLFITSLLHIPSSFMTTDATEILRAPLAHSKSVTIHSQASRSLAPDGSPLCLFSGHINPAALGLAYIHRPRGALGCAVRAT
jgi:hypothetical protein